MTTNDIWYGILEAGDKSSAVVRDLSIQTNNNKIWLYNHARNSFLEYVQAIVEPRLRELTAGDITPEELERAFRAARQSFTKALRIQKWDDKAPVAKAASQKEDAESDLIDDADVDEFIDDIEDD